jgi:hypothetical protein
MAQGNMLLGYARGSVGDVTFFRSGGSQRARARNRKPNNPRSSSQMTQRAKFASAVKFYKRAVSNFFRFAYQDKKTNESDYNAFMRHNIANAPLISKTAFDKQGYPALGNWVLSYGELQPLNYLAGELGSVIEIPGTWTAAPSTLGELSQGLINSGFYEQGDIITVPMIDITGSPLPTATPTGAYTTAWVTAQFRIDYNSPDSLNDLGLGAVTAAIVSNQLTLTFAAHSAFAVIVSRNTSGGLKVSRAEMIYDAEMGLALFNAYYDDNYKAEVLQDWQTSLDAILQGSLSEMSEPPIVPTASSWRVNAYAAATGGEESTITSSDGTLAVGSATSYLNNPLIGLSFASAVDLNKWLQNFDRSKLSFKLGDNVVTGSFTASDPEDNILYIGANFDTRLHITADTTMALLYDGVALTTVNVDFT